VNKYLVLAIPDFGETYCAIVAVVEAETAKQARSIIKPYIGKDRVNIVNMDEWLYDPATGRVGD
jgi:hypothetical protein